MTAVFGVLWGAVGGLLVATTLGGARGDPGMGVVLCATLCIPILVVSLLGAGAGATLARKGWIRMLGLGFFALVAAFGLAGGWVFFAAARGSAESRDAMIPCILAGAAVASTTTGYLRKKGGDLGKA